VGCEVRGQFCVPTQPTLANDNNNNNGIAGECRENEKITAGCRCNGEECAAGRFCAERAGRKVCADQPYVQDSKGGIKT